MRSLAMLVAVVAIGCKSSRSSEPAKDKGSAVTGADARAVDPDAVPDLTKGCAAFAEAQCKLFDRCVPEWGELRFGGHAACVATEIANCNALWALRKSRVSDTSLAACAAAIDRAGCHYLYGEDEAPACVPPRGSLAEGASCVGDAQCASHVCNGGDLEEQRCGTCGAPAPQQGEQCEYACAHGLHCIDRRCEVPRPAGAACSTNRDCETLLECRDGHCIEWKVAGAPCTAGPGDADDCSTPFTCVRHKCVMPTPVGLGKSCTGSQYGPSGNHPCESGLVCDDEADTPTCVTPPKPGDACRPHKDICPVWAPCVAGKCTVVTSCTKT